MIILHSSDLHMNVERLWQFTEFDVWVDTGDFFPNRTRGNRVVEIAFQEQWLRNGPGAKLIEWLAGRPMIALQGNHDYVMLADILASMGAVNATQLNAVPHEVTIGDIRFAGFSNIPFIAGEWSHESDGKQLNDACRRVLAQDPRVLLTHAPPHGILDADHKNHYGIQQLVGKLMYDQHHITHHLFGHVHDDGGKSVERCGIRFVNSARRPQLVEVL